MFADTLLAAERAHLLRLLVWGGTSLLAGLLLFLAARRAGSAPLLKHFAIQTAAWGAIDLAIVAWAWRGLALRDHAGAVSLDRFLWFNTGLDLGYVGIGATLAICGAVMGRRQGAIGAGIGVVVQGMALFVLDLWVAQAIVMR